MRTVPSKLSDVWRVTTQEIKLSLLVAYTEGTEKSLITWDSTAQVRWTVCQLGLLAVQQTGVVNHLVINYSNFMR